MILAPLKTFPIAGHHDKDSGAIAFGVKEADETKKARNLFVANFPKGLKELIVDQDSETNTQLQNRIKPGDGSVILDIHFNAGQPTATGTECFINRKDFANKNSMSYKMADEICKATAFILNIKNRGVKSEEQSQHKRLGILNLGAGCSVLWEIAFITNINDMQQWNAKKETLMKKIAEIVQKYDDMK